MLATEHLSGVRQAINLDLTDVLHYVQYSQTDAKSD